MGLFASISGVFDALSAGVDASSTYLRAHADAIESTADELKNLRRLELAADQAREADRLAKAYNKLKTKDIALAKRAIKGGIF